MEFDRVTRKLPRSETVSANIGTPASEHLLSLPPIAASPQAKLIANDQLTSKDVPNEIVPGPPITKAKLSLTEILPISDPFVGFAGHCFLLLCQGVELVTRWMKPRSVPAELAAQSLLNSPASPWKHWGTSSLGTVCCTIMAALLIPLFSASSSKAFLPIPFLLIIVLVAFQFGRAAGVLGTLAAAFLFAWFLYEPAGLAVSDPVAKSHLIWMMIIGVLLSDLLARFRLRMAAAVSAHKHQSHT